MIERGDLRASKKPRRICTDTVEQALSDLQRFADAGYSLLVFFFDCPGGCSELEEQIVRFGEETIPTAKFIKSKGGWSPTLEV